MKVASAVIPAIFAVALAFGLAPASAEAACFGSGCFVHHHYVQHRSWNNYSRSEAYRNAREDSRQEREFGGTGRW